MMTVTLWLLVSVSYSANNNGNITAVERFQVARKLGDTIDIPEELK